jgi:hypothetical protein
MDTAPLEFESRLTAALDDTPSRIPVILGPCGSGRTTALQRLRAHLSPGAAQYVDLERVTSTPERCFARVTADTPFTWPAPAIPPGGPAEAHLRLLAYFDKARARDGGPATFLLDEVLEFRAFESFPGLRRVMADTLTAFAASRNRFVLATRFETRALRVLRDAPDRYLVVHAPPVSEAAVAADLLRAPGLRSDEAADTAHVIVSLTDGRASYAADLVDAIREPSRRAHDPIGALARLLASGASLSARCRYSYEIRLHRARGCGALKAILGILAEEQPLTLTEIAVRLGRTPGSTKDYLGWLEDVDLIRVQRKRYTFDDPVLRVWVHLHSGCAAPDDERVSEVVQRYALARLSSGPATRG